MTVALLPTRTGLAWSAAQISLQDAAAVADHPLITQHLETAARFLGEAGAPTRHWATRIAAIQVIAARRADVAPTMARRTAYLDVARAASELLALAEDVHDVRPDEECRSVLAQSPDARLTKI